MGDKDVQMLGHVNIHITGLIFCCSFAAWGSCADIQCDFCKNLCGKETKMTDCTAFCCCLKCVVLLSIEWLQHKEHSTPCGYIECCVLKAAISMTLASGRIEWSFSVSVAVWPFSLSIERQFVCDTTGLCRCSDECLWSRSWQRRREKTRGEGREGPNLWLHYSRLKGYTLCIALSADVFFNSQVKLCSWLTGIF